MEKNPKEQRWENIALLCFGLTVLGQGLVAGFYLIAQFVWLTANIISLVRNIVLQRPKADKMRDSGLIGLCVSLICLRLFGIY